MTDWKEAGYSGLAAYGKFKAVMGAIVGTVIFLLMIVFGFKYIGKTTKYSASTNVTLAMTEGCTQTTETKDGNTRTVYTCMVSAEYTVGSDTFTYNDTISSGTKYANGSNVTLYYDPKNPGDATLKYHINPGTLALAGVIIGFLGLFGTWGYTYFVLKNKEIAAVTGGVHLAGDIVGAFRR
ncbi:hypothetical protein EhV442 [Emiliania huxleyi virus 86]|uniref:Putative membrane protein n=2 Tax=Emiliania huxleyi virus 86 TaxID=181082 RepID=Q4A237_EHV8U|nr:hypothetical protein EhV442 [Emiliania huxleyi virus 86]AHA56070.1 putative membrane protein [Emiliania huxleyi virus 164]UKZ11470.1 hypothetical protein EhVM1_000455 [Emiliania huxleyi virus M1]CAI65869.1 putative membrane protein [Emiliania huxleyi virus 86]